jgi:hypothetical protein
MRESGDSSIARFVPGVLGILKIFLLSEIELSRGFFRSGAAGQDEPIATLQHFAPKVLVSFLHKLYTLPRGERLQIGCDPGFKIPVDGSAAVL